MTCNQEQWERIGKKIIEMLKKEGVPPCEAIQMLVGVAHSIIMATSDAEDYEQGFSILRGAVLEAEEIIDLGTEVRREGKQTELNTTFAHSPARERGLEKAVGGCCETPGQRPANECWNPALETPIRTANPASRRIQRRTTRSIRHGMRRAGSNL